MFSPIRSTHRRATPIARLSAVLPAVSHSRKRWQLPVGTAAIVRPMLVVLLIGTAAIIFRDKLASIVTRVDGDAEQAPEAVGEE
jgi:hypothetical protein